MGLFPTGIRNDDVIPSTGPSKLDAYDALVALIALCEKETHHNSGTIMFSKHRKEYSRAKKLIKQIENGRRNKNSESNR